MRPLATVLAAAIAAGSLACSSSRAPPCPGTPITSLTFHAALSYGEGGCVFANTEELATATGLKVSFDFTAMLSTTSDGTALLCPDRPQASPLRGTLLGDHLTVAGPTEPAVPANLPVCPCSLAVAESVDGTLVQGDDGSLSFDGALHNVLSANAGVDPGTCEPTPTETQPGPRCGVPCALHWKLSGKP